MASVRTMCPMNCHPTLCGMLVDVEDGRLLGVRGDPDNPDSQGFLCIRGQASREIIGNGRAPATRWCGSAAARRVAARHVGRGARPRGLSACARPAARPVGAWSGHGLFANNYGTRVASHLLRRFANLWGCQWWNPTMICWGLGGFGLGLTGILEVNTKEDMGAHAALILLWGANLASQPNTARHLTAARRRGAHVVAIDVRETEAFAQADETLLVRPGTDGALALGMMHVLIGERLVDRGFVDTHTVGFDALAGHVASHTPQWAAEVTGVPAERIVALARRYAATKPATIVLGGSSMHKGAGSWTSARAIGCLPALTGNVGIPGGGFGPRHGAATHGQGLASIAAEERRPAGDWIPNQMPRITEGHARRPAARDAGARHRHALVVRGGGPRGRGLARQDLVVAYDLFMSDTARRFADVVLPATAWLEELGCKSTNTHLYLMPKILEAPGETRPITWVLRELARRLGVDDFYPWTDEAGCARRDPRPPGHRPRQRRRARRRGRHAPP
jgi:anaerobic selenocysteine-containing dehydrogenase